MNTTETPTKLDQESALVAAPYASVAKYALQRGQDIIEGRSKAEPDEYQFALVVSTAINGAGHEAPDPADWGDGLPSAFRFIVREP